MGGRRRSIEWTAHMDRMIVEGRACGFTDIAIARSLEVTIGAVEARTHRLRRLGLLPKTRKGAVPIVAPVEPTWPTATALGIRVKTQIVHAMSTAGPRPVRMSLPALAWMGE